MEVVEADPLANRSTDLSCPCAFGPVADSQALPAGKVTKGKRRWFVKAWSAPYSGNHHFLVERFKTCGGKRERPSSPNHRMKE